MNSKRVDYPHEMHVDTGIEGVLLLLTPLPVMLAALNSGMNLSSIWPGFAGDITPGAALEFILHSPVFYFSAAAVAALATFAAAFTILHSPFTGKLSAAIALGGDLIISLPYLVNNPFATFIGTVLIVSAGFFLFDFNIDEIYPVVEKRENLSLKRLQYAVITLSLVAIFGLAADIPEETITIFDGSLDLSYFIVLMLILHASWEGREIRSGSSIKLAVYGIVFSILYIFIVYKNYNIPVTILLFSLTALIIIPPSREIHNRYDQWWEMFLNHPARMMLTTFLALCIAGTILLALPVSAAKSAITIVDAAFTSVSAVCVTGLIVLDTPHDFTVTGQVFILMLIQLGGLGIMSITTVGLHAMGRRLTLRQERLLTTITDTDHKDLIDSLATILKFTFCAEGAGALILTALFYFQTGDALDSAMWRGVFTAISAFCNAGFALQTDNLMPYQEFPLILHTVATLIIFGGIAPATTLLIPNWIRGEGIPVASFLALATTIILLLSGTIFILVFEWNGLLANFSIVDKIHNAWFQSVTLRTAGFNSINIAGSTPATYLIMICLMFIGGSPGGTAGGVKTTTIGILALTFWSNITNHKSVVILNRRVQSRIIYRAITIVASGALTWLVIILMLEVTQQIPPSELIFEVTSAMGTVGLSTGATTHLDEMGKVIIMIAMFAGRVGPITIFMLLSGERYDNPSRYQNAKISLT